MHRQAREGYRVLVCAPFGRDADSICDLLGRNGYVVRTCPDLDAVAADIDDDTGAIILTEECFQQSRLALAAALDTQPPWSDVPFVLLAARRTGRLAAAETLRGRLPEQIINVVVLERPLSAESLVSTVAAVMRARQKQFEMRDRLAELTASRTALEDSERELRLVADSLPVLIAFVDKDLRYRFANLAYRTWLGIDPGAIIGRTVPEVMGPQIYEQRREGIEQALRGISVQVELPWPMPGRPDAQTEVRYIPRFTDSGEVDGFHVFVLDVTERHRSERQLREAAAMLETRVAERTAELSAEMARREGVEEALRQSQKMEAIGQLTGGIAHDFNNMLAGVIGSLDLMRRRIEKGDYATVDRYMTAAMQSAQRAATLTARLLAFGRRQSLDLKPVDLDQLVAGMEDLLRRTLGENIRIVIDLGAGGRSVNTDVSQIENALLNLAINARDAMPEGGLLSIGTRLASRLEIAALPNATGPFAVLSVEDTGSGMTPETLAKVFEPFFTTKPIGQGTGLGLSQIYGFMRQSGGHITITSEPGEGTAIRLFLPLAGAQADQAGEAPASAPGGRGETVLLVEDEELVRMLVVEVLNELGYRPLEAASADAAIPILQSGERIDLLVTDVGLPGMNGRQLAEIARDLRPELKVLFVTGYAEKASVRAEFLGDNMEMIGKPFAFETLATTIRQMIEG
ncbi:PAS domain-containing sensor histidine kinase [Mangrovicella endophytica]|uniref:PAS domain-containing sensor histidine kinase n=1 Tax=Mangrovicella endophytica TaxID=2066697 RepID=UPI000C9E56CD|nr:PAS domain-containing sensor histidine kinase [Mangrovicella endophytica]